MNNFLLEIINGAAVTPEYIWLAMLGVYLSRESRRRGLHWFNWFRLPPSMNLMLAIFICDAAIITHSWVMWAWRRFDGDAQFGPSQTTVMIISGAFVLIGTLCKIRALTHPDHGNWPWLIATGVTALSALALIIF